MLRYVLCAVVALGISLTAAKAETLKGKITKIDGTKVTFQTLIDKKAKTFSDAKEYTFVDKVTVSKMIKKKQKETIDDGLKAEQLKNIDSVKGLRASLEVNADGKVTEVTIFAKKKKKNDNQ